MSFIKYQFSTVALTLTLPLALGLSACGGGSKSSSGKPNNGGSGGDVQNTAPKAKNVTILYGYDKVAISDVTGVKEAGVFLTAEFSYSDADNDVEDSSQTAYRWLLDGAEVSTESAYHSRRSDAGKNITVEVIPAAKTGELKGQVAVSATAVLTAREQVFFSASGRTGEVSGPSNSPVYAPQLYITDGTDDFTLALTELNGASPSKPVALPGAKAGYATEKWLFTLDDKLWVTDGTRAGTFALQADDNGNAVDVVYAAKDLVAFNGYVYFQGDDYDGASNIQNREIWRTDGTVAGTELVVDLHPLGNSNAEKFIVMADSLYFIADFKYEGTNYGKEIYRLEKDHSYSLVKDINPGSVHSDPVELAVIDDTLYFSAKPTAGTSAAYASDGTEAGTIELIRYTISSAHNFVGVNDAVYFTQGNAGVLFRTTGTAASTKAVVFNSSAFSTDVVEITASFDDLLILRATKQGRAYSGLIGFKEESSSVNTSFVLDIVETPSIPAVLQNRIVFVADTPSSNTNRLYYSSRTDINNSLASKIDINPSGTPMPQDLAVINNQVLFTATTADYGQELWITDGTETGTQLFQDIRPGTTGSSPTIFGSAWTVLNNE